jgi:5-methylcytosine-specific restriction endonuclease McrA
VIGHLNSTGQYHPGPSRNCRVCSRPELRTYRWQKTRLHVIQRDGGCKMADGTCKGRLSAHHIKRGGPDTPDNLVTLCRKHHDQVEGTVFLRRPPGPESASFREKYRLDPHGQTVAGG